MAIRFLTAGESHGRGLVGILEGIPSGFTLSAEDIDCELKRRQGGYGRGGRMKIESDRAEFVSGIRWGKTLGSPIGLLIENRDWKNWTEGMSPEARLRGSLKAVTRPRPGHADLAGALKYDHDDVRNVLERSSARETAMRVGLGAIAKKVLSDFGIAVGSYVVGIGSLKARISGITASPSGLNDLFRKAEKSPVRCPSEDMSRKMKLLIDRARQGGNSLGGVFEVFAHGLPVGLGSHVHWDRRLDGRLAQAVMSVQAIKGVEVGLGFAAAGSFGSEVMDEIRHRKSGRPAFYRTSNNAGGIEGGITNGMPLIVRAAMKPIPTLRKPLMSVDLKTKKPYEAAYERSDVCAVPAAAVVAEAMIALVLADEFFGKFGGDSAAEVRRNYKSYMAYLAKR